jgi:hypothetical protein
VTRLRAFGKPAVKPATVVVMVISVTPNLVCRGKPSPGLSRLDAHWAGAGRRSFPAASPPAAQRAYGGLSGPLGQDAFLTRFRDAYCRPEVEEHSEEDVRLMASD